MNNVLANRTTRRRGLTYALLLAICLVLMAFSSTPVVGDLQGGLAFAFRPVQLALTEVGRGAASVVDSITEIDQLRQANQQLVAENQRLAAENARLAELGRQNEELTGLLQLRSGITFETVAAQVIAREASQFRRLVTVDQGTDRGVAVGDVAIAAGGALAGRVIEVGTNFARIRLMTDTESTVIGHDASNGATGEVVGQLGGVLLMRNVDATQRLRIGDEVLTAGIELADGIRSPYPKGLLIGQIIDIQRDPNAVVQTAFVEPALDLDRLEYLLVIVDYRGGLPEPVDQPTPVTNPDGTLPDSEQPFVTQPPTAAPSPTL